MRFGTAGMDELQAPERKKPDHDGATEQGGKKRRKHDDGNGKSRILLHGWDIWMEIFGFLGPGYYYFVAPVSKGFNKMYKQYFYSLKPQNLPIVHQGRECRKYTFVLEALEQANMVCDRGSSSFFVNAKRARLVYTHTFLNAAFSSRSCFNEWHNSGLERLNLIPTKHRTVYDVTAYIMGYLTKERFPEDAWKWAIDTGYAWTINSAEAIALKGSLATFKQAIETEMPIFRGTMDTIAMEGHNDLIEHIFKEGTDILPSASIFRSATFLPAAAAGGQLETLELLLTRQDMVDCGHAVLQAAADYGHVHIFQWAQEKGASLNSEAFSLTTTAARGHVDFLKFASRKYPSKLSAAVMKSAAGNGQLDALQFLTSSGVIYPPEAFNEAMLKAALNGHLNVVQFLRSPGVPLTVEVMVQAAKSGKVALVKYVHENSEIDLSGQVRHLSMDCYAAVKGHLDVLMYLIEQGHPWTHFCGHNVLFHAAQNDQLEIFQFAHENGCPWDKFALLRASSLILDYVSSTLIDLGWPGAVCVQIR